MGTAPPLTRADIAICIAILRDQLGLPTDTAALARASAEHPEPRTRQLDAGRATLLPELGTTRH